MNMAVFRIIVPCCLDDGGSKTSETSLHSTRLHGAPTQKTAIFILVAMTTSSLAADDLLLRALLPRDRST
jgi:hypothetical protein